MRNFRQTTDLIWNIADLLRGDYKPREYVDVILPLTVFYRLDLAMRPTRTAVREAYEAYKGKLDDMDDLLRSQAGGSLVYNTSPFDWKSLLEAEDDIAHNLIHYLNGYSPEVQDIIEKFDFRRQVSRLQASQLLVPIMREFTRVDLHPDRVSNLQMGYIFEELIRKFSEQYNETAGEHFTPREVIRLMVELLFNEGDPILTDSSVIRTFYDPACGTGGMLTEAKNHVLNKHDEAVWPQLSEKIMLYGQELNPTAFAVAKSDLLLKGEDPNRIYYGNSFSDDGYQITPTTKLAPPFDYMLSNPPFGVSWKKVEWVIKREHQTLGENGRFGAGLPRINDGALLFLQHILSKRHTDGKRSRIAIIFNGSPLFTGDAGSGESEIRRWIIENDWLEGIVALPDQLFYNTGINTYIWVLTNQKSAERKGKIQLVNATSFFQKMKKSLGSKRHEITADQIATITQTYKAFADGDNCRIYDNHFFGYRKVRIDRPLRLNFQATPERINRLENERGFVNLAKSKKKKDKALIAAEEAAGRELQQRIQTMLTELSDELIDDRALFLPLLKQTAKAYQIKLTAGITKAILSALGEKDETAKICIGKNGKPEPDNDLRDYESIPLTPDAPAAAYTVGDSWLDEKVPLTEEVWAYFKREVQPHVADAFIDTSFVDAQDQQVGKVGYEINFNRYFYEYQPPRPLTEIEADIRSLEKEIVQLLSAISNREDGKV